MMLGKQVASGKKSSPNFSMAKRIRNHEKTLISKNHLEPLKLRDGPPVGTYEPKLLNSKVGAIFAGGGRMEKVQSTPSLGPLYPLAGMTDGARLAGPGGTKVKLTQCMQKDLQSKEARILAAIKRHEAQRLALEKRLEKAKASKGSTSSRDQSDGEELLPHQLDRERLRVQGIISKLHDELDEVQGWLKADGTPRNVFAREGRMQAQKGLSKVGPGQYNIRGCVRPGYMAKTFGTSHRAYDTAVRPGGDSEKLGRQSPGPGAYREDFGNPELGCPDMRQGSFSFSKQHRDFKQEATKVPGPGSYNISSFTEKLADTKGTAFGRPRRRRARFDFRKCVGMQDRVWGIN